MSPAIPPEDELGVSAAGSCTTVTTPPLEDGSDAGLDVSAAVVDPCLSSFVFVI